MVKIEDYLIKFEKILLSIDRVELTHIISEIKKEFSPEQIVNHLIVPSLIEIGDMWQKGDAALAQIYMSGRLCQEIIEKVFHNEIGSQKPYPKIGIAVLEDHHPLGVQIIKNYLKSFGIKFIEYKIGITSEELQEQVIKDKIEILLISTLMLRSALKIKVLANNLKQQQQKIMIIVGGAPFVFDKTLWKNVGADASSSNAFDVISIINKKLEVSINE